jgi:hypothetical protein
VALFDLLDFDALAGEMKVALEQLEMDANYEGCVAAVCACVLINYTKYN